MQTLLSQHTVKIASAGLSALTITFLLFAAMQQLIKTDGIKPQVSPVYLPIELFNPPPESDVIKNKVLPPMPELKPRDLPKVEPTVDTLTNLTPGFDPIDRINIPRSSGPDTMMQSGERSATPLVRVEPRYPTEAARDGISGWVRLSFTIDETGAVTDVAVLAAEPATLFNREAVRALRRWKYQPQLVDGKAVKQQNMQVQLDFSLQND
ncbi:protein TonB [Rheinheimera pacifica]|uniref:energy transducer TonB n=1 Tax=Rheinheimera pacifica TaxID=173990 RepID=UPI0021697FFE|nr:energy transducer TonB [Rheinheimera pacifica]MCS4308843.1 protein TonB [Rheinheimera pacifica]